VISFFILKDSRYQRITVSSSTRQGTTRVSVHRAHPPTSASTRS